MTERMGMAVTPARKRKREGVGGGEVKKEDKDDDRNNGIDMNDMTINQHSGDYQARTEEDEEI